MNKFDKKVWQTVQYLTLTRGSSTEAQINEALLQFFHSIPKTTEKLKKSLKNLVENGKIFKSYDNKRKIHFSTILTVKQPFQKYNRV